MVPQKCQQQQKGKPPPTPIAAPPPVRESNRQVAAEGESERVAALSRDGYRSTLKRKSLLNQDSSDYNQPGSRSLL